MSPLNDDELRALLEQAKSAPLEPRPEMKLKALRAYQENVVRPLRWRRFLLRPVPISLPVGTLAAVLLILIGVAGDRAFRQPSAVVRTRSVELPVTRERVVYSDCSPSPQGASPPAISLFKKFQPVSQINPRVIGSSQNVH